MLLAVNVNICVMVCACLAVVRIGTSSKGSVMCTCWKKFTVCSSFTDQDPEQVRAAQAVSS